MTKEIETQILSLCKDVKADPTFDGCFYTYLDDTFALVFCFDGTDVYGKIAFNDDDLQSDYDWDWIMPVDPDDNEVIDTEMVYSLEQIQNMTAEEIAADFMQNYDDMISLLGRETGSQKPAEDNGSKIAKAEGNESQIDDLDISDLPDMPDAKPCTYQVWLLGFDEEDNAIDAEEMLTEFDDADEAVRYAKSNTVLNHELPQGAHSAEVRVEEVVSVDGGEMEVGTIYTDRI